MSSDTKERILYKALEIFSQKGFEGTNIREISESLGLTKSVFYKHYKSKEELWNSLLEHMENYYNMRFGSEQNLPPIPNSAESFKELVLNMFNYTIHDEKVVMTRKILLIEQFHDERARILATKHFIFGLGSMFSKIFERMMENGILKSSDPNMLSFAFTTPISALVRLCDRQPEMEKEAAEKVQSFTEMFLRDHLA